MATIVQANLRRSRLAQNMLDQYVGESGADLLLLCEQYRGEDHNLWFKDLTGVAVIKIQNAKKFSVIEEGA